MGKRVRSLKDKLAAADLAIKKALQDPAVKEEVKTLLAPQVSLIVSGRSRRRSRGASEATADEVAKQLVSR